MIPVPTGWRRIHHGGDVVLIPPRGPELGGIRYIERRAPLAPITTLIQQFVTERPFVVSHVGEIERLTTIEGEHAALVTIHGTMEGLPVQRDVGFVLLDHHYARIGSLTLDPAAFAPTTAIVRSLVQSDVQMRGVRARRFEHDDIVGWQPRARGLAADWYPLEFPLRSAVIQISPALPKVRVESATVLAGLLESDARRSGWHGEMHASTVEPASRYGLSGIEEASRGAFDKGPQVVRVRVVLEDAIYVYPIQLEVAVEQLDATLPAMRQVVASIRPIPRPVSNVAPFPHWED